MVVHEPVAAARPRADVADLVALLEGYLDDLARQTAARIGEVGGVGVTLGVEEAPLTVGASSALAHDVDQLQYVIGTGPCLHALRTGETSYVPDLAADHRWGDYGRQAAARGAASCLSVPVLVEGRPAAALKVYAVTVDGLTEAQQRLAAVVALEIAGSIGLARRLTAQASELHDRTTAMDTRRSIDLALGMLMERHHQSADDAFALLRRYSQHFNVKLVDAAQQVIGSGPGGSVGTTPAPFQRHGVG